MQVQELNVYTRLHAECWEPDMFYIAQLARLTPVRQKPATGILPDYDRDNNRRKNNCTLDQLVYASMVLDAGNVSAGRSIHANDITYFNEIGHLYL